MKSLDVNQILSPEVIVAKIEKITDHIQVVTDQDFGNFVKEKELILVTMRDYLKSLQAFAIYMTADVECLTYNQAIDLLQRMPSTKEFFKDD